jgi:hypothetical protein
MSSYARTLVVLIGLVLASFAAPTPAHAVPAPERNGHGLKDKSVTVSLEFPQRPHTTVVGPTTYYYCTTLVFAPFNDLEHWDIAGVTYNEKNFPDEPSAQHFKQVFPPYDDGYTLGGDPFPPTLGQHHAMIQGFMNTDSVTNSSTAAQCAIGLAKAQGIYGTTAVLLYHPDNNCEKAAAKVDLAKKAVAKAKQTAASTTGQAHKQALAKLRKAEAKLKKAKKKFTVACPKP